MENHLKRAKKIATLLDSKYSFLGIKFGLDPVVNILPGVGSVVGAITSCYAFWIAAKLNVPNSVYFRMVYNIIVDLIFGGIPVIGVIFDVFYKSNLKNIELLEKYIKPHIIDAEIVD